MSRGEQRMWIISGSVLVFGGLLGLVFAVIDGEVLTWGTLLHVPVVAVGAFYIRAARSRGSRSTE